MKHEGRSHGLTVQALEAGPAHWRARPSSCRGPDSPSGSKHEGTAHGLTVQGRAHGLTASRRPRARPARPSSCPSPSSRSRAGLTDSPSKPSKLDGLTVAAGSPSRAHEPVQALEAREPGPRAHRRARSTRARPTGSPSGSTSRPSKLDRLTVQGRRPRAGPAHGPGPGLTSCTAPVQAPAYR